MKIFFTIFLAALVILYLLDGLAAAGDKNPRRTKKLNIRAETAQQSSDTNSNRQKLDLGFLAMVACDNCLSRQTIDEKVDMPLISKRVQDWNSMSGREPIGEDLFNEFSTKPSLTNIRQIRNKIVPGFTTKFFDALDDPNNSFNVSLKETEEGSLQVYLKCRSVYNIENHNNLPELINLIKKRRVDKHKGFPKHALSQIEELWGAGRTNLASPFVKEIQQFVLGRVERVYMKHMIDTYRMCVNELYANFFRTD